jgi:hypothetical protein
VISPPERPAQDSTRRDSNPQFNGPRDEGPRLRPRGHWNRQLVTFHFIRCEDDYVHLTGSGRGLVREVVSPLLVEKKN